MHRSAGLYTNFTACDRPELLNIKELIFKRKSGCKLMPMITMPMCAPMFCVIKNIQTSNQI